MGSKSQKRNLKQFMSKTSHYRRTLFCIFWKPHRCVSCFCATFARETQSATTFCLLPRTNTHSFLRSATTVRMPCLTSNIPFFAKSSVASWPATMSCLHDTDTTQRTPRLAASARPAAAKQPRMNEVSAPHYCFTPRVPFLLSWFRTYIFWAFCSCSLHFEYRQTFNNWEQAVRRFMPLGVTHSALVSC